MTDRYFSQQTWSGFSPTTVLDNNRQSGLNNRQSGLSLTTVPEMPTGFGICLKDMSENFIISIPRIRLPYPEGAMEYIRSP